MSEDNRFYKPSIDVWKYNKEPEEAGEITTKEKDKVIRGNVKFFDWQLSFTKTCVQIAFILFVLANIYILIMMTINYNINYSIDMLDTYINNVFSMFVDVIGGYIIKSATENSLKIVMSVFSDYVEKKYNTPLVTNEDIFINPHGIINDEYYNELLYKELDGANINTGEADDDGSRFEAGTVVYGANIDPQEKDKEDLIYG